MASLDGASELQKPVGEGRLPMVYMRDYGEVTNPLRRILGQVDGALLAVGARVGAKTMTGAETAIRLRVSKRDYVDLRQKKEVLRRSNRS